MEIAKDLFYIFSMLASTAFSFFMMYSMYKTKKGVEQIAKTSQEFTEQLGDKINQILPSFGIGLPTEEIFRPLNENEKDLFSDEANERLLENAEKERLLENSEKEK